MEKFISVKRERRRKCFGLSEGRKIISSQGMQRLHGSAAQEARRVERRPPRSLTVSTREKPLVKILPELPLSHACRAAGKLEKFLSCVMQS